MTSPTHPLHTYTAVRCELLTNSSELGCRVSIPCQQQQHRSTSTHSLPSCLLLSLSLSLSLSLLPSFSLSWDAPLRFSHLMDGSLLSRDFIRISDAAAQRSLKRFVERALLEMLHRRARFLFPLPSFRLRVPNTCCFTASQSPKHSPPAARTSSFSLSPFRFS